MQRKAKSKQQRESNPTMLHVCVCVCVVQPPMCRRRHLHIMSNVPVVRHHHRGVVVYRVIMSFQNLTEYRTKKNHEDRTTSTLRVHMFD